MIKVFKNIWKIFFLYIIISSCTSETEQPNDFVAQVNDQYLLNEQLQYSIPEGLDDDLVFALKKELINSWVENEIIYQSALNEGFSLGSKEQYLINSYKKSLLIQIYLNQKLDRDYAISQKDINEYYREHKREFIRNTDEVHIIHLFTEQSDRAIFSEIAETGDLMQIIRKYYFNEKSTKELPNGDLGYIAANRLPEIIMRMLTRQKTGSVSQPIKTNDGYHFIQLIDWQKEGTQKGIEQVKNEITRRLQADRRNTELERFLEGLKQKAQIQTYLSKIK
ncbi:MAG: peptidyl-prolyl cis-trans isomerase [Calditrichaceae bacterium]|nr:peptidyl-prolyl cis-trans isomerase [Calditrichaceae bacterium]MBN2710775.1 peptidyl-prolyl cis-trans isomerase [Calditrichaceae bacterium]